jgi:hypothetical protein
VCPFPWPPVRIPSNAAACDMNRERQPSSLASPLHHASDTHSAERLAALIDEDVGRLNPVRLLLPVQELETVHLIALEVMDAVSAALEPAGDESALPQVDIIPAQIASLRHPQTMAIDDQPDQPIPACRLPLRAASSLSISASVKCSLTR